MEVGEQRLGLGRLVAVRCLRWTAWTHWSGEEVKNPEEPKRRCWSGEVKNPEGGAGVEKK